MNGGNTWVSLNSQLGINLRKVSFLNNDTGFVLADGRIILRTTNGGTWSWLSYNFTSASFLDVSFPDANIWYVLVSGSIVFRTTDTGAIWTGLYTGDNTGFSAIHFFDANTGIITGGDKVRKTTNGGTSWSQTSLPGLGLKTLSFLNSDIGISAGSGGQFYKTIDGGISWSSMQSYSTRNNFQSVYFLNSMTGFAAGGNFPYSYSIMKTTDGGSLWTTVNSGYNYSNTEVDFTDDMTGYVTNSSGKVFITNNGGSTWSGHTILTGVSLTSVDFVNSSTGYVSTANGKVFKTDNGGSQWYQTSETGFTNYINSINLIDANTVFCAGNGGIILKTTNGGLNWHIPASGTPNDLYSIYFTDLLNGYASGSNIILKTTNGGGNWNIVRQITGESISSIMFTDNLTGYSCGGGGLILKTTDAGITWSKQNSKTNFSLSRIFFINSDQGFACGTSGTILSTGSGGLTVAQQNLELTPKYFYLHQNYPNPFNPSTIIRYSLIENSFVTLKVYDVLGNEIATLVNEKQNRGSYDYQFSTVNYHLSSGIYFYKLEAGSFIETKRMILLK